MQDPDNVYMMRKWAGEEPGLINQKTPTTLLLTPGGDFHSFGFTARNHYHNLEAAESTRWLYFEKFKMALHHKAVGWEGQGRISSPCYVFCVKYYRDDLRSGSKSLSKGEGRTAGFVVKFDHNQKGCAYLGEKGEGQLLADIYKLRMSAASGSAMARCRKGESFPSLP